MTEAYFKKLKSAVLGHCVYGKDNACSGDPLHAKALRRPPCPMYVAGQGCTKREIAAAKFCRR